MNYLGKYLKKRLRELKMSEREISAECGISHSYLNQLIKGINPSTKKNISPTLATLEKLAKGFGVTTEHLQQIARGCANDKKNPSKSSLSGGFTEHSPEFMKQIKDFQKFIKEIGLDKMSKSEAEWTSILTDIKEIVEKNITEDVSKKLT